MWVNSSGKIVSLERRKDFEVKKFLTNLLKNKLQTGIPKGLQGDLKKGFKISNQFYDAISEAFSVMHKS